MTARANFLLRMSACGLIAASVGYWFAGPAGVLAAARIPLQTPQSLVDSLGGALASVDPADWSRACAEADLPAIPDPTRIEFEPIRRLVEHSARWTLDSDGDALGRVGEILLALDQHESAIDFFAAACEFGTQRARWFYFLGCECQVAGRPAAAVQAFARAAELEPGYGLTHTRMGQVLSELGRVEQARAALERGARLAPGASLALAGLARLSLAAGDAAQALIHIDRSLAIVPNDHIAAQMRAQILTGLGRSQEAEREQLRSRSLPHYRGLLSFDSRLQEAHAAASTHGYHENSFGVAIAKRDYERAGALGEILAQRQPRNPDAWRRVAAVFATAGKHELARQRIETALELDPDAPATLCSAAEIAIASRDMDWAARMAERSVQLAPASAEAFQVLARVRYFQGRESEAVIHAQRAVALAPTAINNVKALVEILRQYRRNPEAERALREFLRLVPSDAWAIAELNPQSGGN